MKTNKIFALLLPLFVLIFAAPVFAQTTLGDQTFQDPVTFVTEVKSDKVNERTAAAGVTIDGVLLKDGAVTATGSLLSTSATSIGWSLQSGANTACNTTCTNGCVLGQNTADMALVDCAAATADVCICAGAN